MTASSKFWTSASLGSPVRQTANVEEIFGRTATGTMPGVLMGTFRYMSPEQIRGEVVGPPTDVFSMGTGLVRTVD